MMITQNIKIAMAGIAMLAMGATSAVALTASSIPGSSATNEGISVVYTGAGELNLDGSRSGWYGANLYLLGGPANITVEYFGMEAGFRNSFHMSDGNGGPQNELFFEQNRVVDPLVPIDNDSFTGSALGTTVLNNVASGLLDFSFQSNGKGGVIVQNGANPDGAGDETFADFFTTFSNSTQTSGQSVDLWFDDSGGGLDDNHDDFMIRLSVTGGTFAVPVPTSVALLLTGLAGLGIAARRRA